MCRVEGQACCTLLVHPVNVPACPTTVRLHRTHTLYLLTLVSLSARRYEGTYEVNVLVSGRDITGTAAFRPAPSRKQKELTSEGRV